jgi:hypothetical protein
MAFWMRILTAAEILTVPNFDALLDMSCRHATKRPHDHVRFVYGCLSQLPPPQNLTLYWIRPADNNSSIESKVHCDIRGYPANHGNTSEILGYLTPWGPQICTTLNHTETPQSNLSLDLLAPMSEPNKTDIMHTERIDEVEAQEARPKIALSTILAVFVSVSNRLLV